MDIMNALKKTVESVRDWTNEKLENKVEKVANKGLSTNDYTTADKNKVNNIPSDLTIIDGKIYLNGGLTKKQLDFVMNSLNK